MFTLQKAFADFLKNRKNLKPKTIYDYERIMVTCFSDWQEFYLINITPALVKERHKAIGKNNGEAYANLAMRVLRAVFNFASAHYEDEEGNPLIVLNPVRPLTQKRTWYKVAKRTTVFTPQDLMVFFAAVNELKERGKNSKAQVVKDYLLFLLLSGLRRQETARLKWTQVNWEARIITLKQTGKSGIFVLPMSDNLMEILKNRFAQKTNEYIFPGKSAAGYIIEPRRQMTKIANQSGLSFTLDDLRRTYTVIAEGLNIPAYAVKHLVYHKQDDAVIGYAALDVKKLRAPMQKISNAILDLAGGKSIDKEDEEKVKVKAQPVQPKQLSFNW